MHRGAKRALRAVDLDGFFGGPDRRPVLVTSTWVEPDLRGVVLYDDRTDGGSVGNNTWSDKRQHIDWGTGS